MRVSFLIFAIALAAGAQPPNVLFLAIDDLRPELGSYGAAHMLTPHMDALAGQGRLFRNHYVAVPTCGASRYALLTGLRPTSATDDNNAFNQMPTQEPASPESWVDLLRRNGWRTASIGKITHEPDGYRWNFPTNYDSGRSSATHPDMQFSWDEVVFDHGQWGAQRYPLFAYADGTGRVRNVTPAFEIGVDDLGQSLPDEAYPDGRMAEAAVEKLREFADDGRRFCLAVGFYKPHLPFNAPKAYYDLYDPGTLPAPQPVAKPLGANPSTTGQSGEPGAYAALSDRAALRHAYFACVSYVDAQVGKVLAELDALGLADNTLVILWGDHGWCLDDYGLLGKHVVLEHGVESPLIIRPPANLCPDVFAGIPAEGVVETIDIYHTIAEICGLAAPSSAVGASLVPMLRTPFAPGKDVAYSRFGGVTTVRSPDWRLISSGGVHDLYDLSSFRYELEDVSASHPSVASDLAAKLTVAGSRPGTTYSAWAAGDPALIDPAGDADLDGSSNLLEYASGSDPLDAMSRPAATLLSEDLTGLGFTEQEIVYRYTVATHPDQLTLFPFVSTNLLAWSFAPLRFLDATYLNNETAQLRFRLATYDNPRQFFRLSSSCD